MSRFIDPDSKLWQEKLAKLRKMVEKADRHNAYLLDLVSAYRRSVEKKQKEIESLQSQIDEMEEKSREVLQKVVVLSEAVDALDFHRNYDNRPGSMGT